MIDVENIRGAPVPCCARLRAGAGGRAIPHCWSGWTAGHGSTSRPTAGFPRAPEPIPENLGELGQLVRQTGADIGMAVDPDVDRLALVDETGTPIGEDYTLAFAVRAVLGAARQVTVRKRRHRGGEPVHQPGGRGCRPGYGARFVRAPVGEANVARAIGTRAR